MVTYVSVIRLHKVNYFLEKNRRQNKIVKLNVWMCENRRLTPRIGFTTDDRPGKYVVRLVTVAPVLLIFNELFYDLVRTTETGKLYTQIDRLSIYTRFTIPIK